MVWHPDTDVRGARTARLVYKALYTVLYEKERRTDGENLARIRIKLFCLFFKIVLADAEEANKVIIITPISESDTLLFAVSHH